MTAGSAGLLGRAFAGFLSCVAAAARRRGADRVFFLTSEGEWFAATYPQFLAALASPGHRRRLGQALADSGWPLGLLRRDLPWLLPLLRPALVRLDPRLPGAPEHTAPEQAGPAAV